MTKNAASSAAWQALIEPGVRRSRAPRWMPPGKDEPFKGNDGDLRSLGPQHRTGRADVPGGATPTSARPLLQSPGLAGSGPLRSAPQSSGGLLSCTWRGPTAHPRHLLTHARGGGSCSRLRRPVCPAIRGLLSVLESRDWDRSSAAVATRDLLIYSLQVLGPDRRH